MTYELMVKSIDGAATADVAAPLNPGMIRRTAADLDPGRPWSGDEYDEGPVSDPADAFAHFTLPATTDPTTGQPTVDTEAWMDRNDDGTVIGWVRQGGDVWRYADPEAWALDVDGAQMQPVAGEGELAADPAPVEGAPAEEAAETPAAEDEEGVDLPPSPDDEEFENPFADPAGEPDAAAAAAADNTVLTDDKGVPVDPAADPAPVADPPDPDPKVGAPADQPAAPGSPVDPSIEDPESENYRGVRDPVREKPEPILDETEQDRLFKKRGGTKALLTGIAPGPRRLEHKAHFAGECDGDSGDKEPSPSGDSKPSSPAPTPPRPTAKQASLHPDTLGKLEDADLDALAAQGDLYDHDTMLAVAKEKDRRHSQDSALRELVGDAPPRSPQRAAVFDSVIPAQWSEWAATKSKYSRAALTRQKEVEGGYDDYLMQLLDEAQNDPMLPNGFWKAEYRANPPFDPILFFTGNRRASLAKYASREFQEWMGTHRPMSKTQWLAEFYESAEKAARNLDSSYLTEYG